MAMFPQWFKDLVPSTRSHPLNEAILRLATACAAVVGLAAMATPDAVGNDFAFNDGVYLYGESPVADTVGETYTVFRVLEDQISGAVYQPFSSFDCLRGRVEAERLHLTLVDAYDQTERPYTMALTSTATTTATTRGLGPQPTPVGMHPIQSLSDLDLRLLATCSQPQQSSSW